MKAFVYIFSVLGLGGFIFMAGLLGWWLRPWVKHRWAERLRRQRAAEPLEPGWDEEAEPAEESRPTLVKVCAWCATTERVVEWPTGKVVTHGICGPCERKYFGSLKGLAKGEF